MFVWFFSNNINKIQVSNYLVQHQAQTGWGTPTLAHGLISQVFIDYLCARPCARQLIQNFYKGLDAQIVSSSNLLFLCFIPSCYCFFSPYPEVIRGQSWLSPCHSDVSHCLELWILMTVCVCVEQEYASCRERVWGWWDTPWKSVRLHDTSSTAVKPRIILKERETGSLRFHGIHWGDSVTSVVLVPGRDLTT